MPRPETLLQDHQEQKAPLFIEAVRWDLHQMQEGTSKGTHRLALIMGKVPFCPLGHPGKKPSAQLLSTRVRGKQEENWETESSLS